MFPNQFDRWNVLYFLVENFCEKSGISAKDLQDRGQISQSLVSHLFNFQFAEDLIEGKKGTPKQKPCSVNTLKKVCGVLKFSDARTNALIWLLEDVSDDPDKKREILQMLDEIARFELDKTNSLFAEAASADSHFKEIKVEIAGTKGFFNDDSANQTFSEHRETLQKRLYQMSVKRGHRMVVSKFPTSATHPDGADKHLTSKDNSRVTRFQNNIRPNGCGERHIHSKPTIERYLNERSNCSFLEIDKRREHVQNLINTLKDTRYPNFQVGLSEDEPEVELAMRSIDVIVIRTTAREILLSDKSFACGPSYLFIHDKMTVLSCFLDFEREWERIPQEFREKSRVIEWLKDTLDKSINQERRKTDIKN